MKVKATQPHNGVVLWERHPDHPGGEVFIVGKGEFEVGDTPAVRTRLKDGRLEEVKTITTRKSKRGNTK